jgi:putative transcriptional regulator
MTAAHPTHHLTDEWLVDYAAGAAPEPVALLVATHLSYCPACRAANARLEAVGGALLDDIAPAAVSAAAWSRMEALLDAPEESPATSPAEAPTPPAALLATAGVPGPLRRYAPAGLSGLRWSRVGLHAGRAVLPCPTAGGYQASLLRIGAGRAIVHHGHRGEELLLVLAGSFSDETGRYAQGDVAIYDESVVHRPVAGREEECICLALANAPIRMTGLFTRLLNPFLRH